MNLILVERAEIICLCILTFILLYSRFYKMGKDQANFLRICIFAIGHVIFDLITVMTVNNLDIVPSIINRVSHIIFYLFALLFSYEFFCYVVSICHKKSMLRKIRLLGLIPVIAYAFTVPFLGMEYLSGNGTNYSFGAAAIVGYGVAMFLFILSIIVVLINVKRLDKYIVGALLPMLGLAIVVELIQIVVPEMLFTGGTVTLITVGFFFSLENPVVVLRQKVLTDALTGVKSRHSYESEIVLMNQDFLSGTRFGMVFIDINGLKAVNDTMGHLVGDEYIGNVAQILMDSLKSADEIYRMGGDEFLAVYKNCDKWRIMGETDTVEAACEEKSQEKMYKMSVAIGTALSDMSYKSLKDVLRVADFRMYTEKVRMKQQNALMFIRDGDIDVVGLTDRVFDVLSAAESNRFLFVTNVSTGVTRWSVSAVEYLGLPNTFIHDCNKVLGELIHPEDRKTFVEDTTEVISGKCVTSEATYRIKSAGGEYVNCHCTGTYLRGRNDEPDLFAGSLKIHEAAESIDIVTGLRNSREMTNSLRALISANASAAVMQFGITNLSRINMLYGFINGNEVLKQFAILIRSLVDASFEESGEVFCFDSTRFVVIAPNASKEDLAELYKKLARVVEQQIRLDTISPPLKLAAGALILPKNYTGTASFLQSGLVFAYDRSKYNEHGRLVFYDSTLDTLMSGERQNRLLSIHKDAIGKCESFYITFQPIVRSSDDRIIGAESLVRWRDEVFGEVAPNDFVPWLEGDPCFVSLGTWILKKSLAEAKSMLVHIPEFILNVNVAMQQLEREDFCNEVLEILEETKFPASQLCLELTERCRELNPEFLKSRVEFFRSHNIKIALDDFGTGFSSFSLLIGLKVDEIKLNQAILSQIKTNKSSQILTKMLIDVSQSLGCSTCLEGVEDEEICEYLKKYDATYYQGYFCSRALTIDEFSMHAQSWNSSQTSKTVRTE